MNMLSKIILGTVQLGMPYGINNSVGQPLQAAANNILETALSQGVSCLDTSDMYGTSSEVIREFGSDKFQILSKFILEDSSSFKSKLQASLSRLGCKQLAGYSFHRFSDYEKFNDWNAVEEAKATGLIKRLGVSVYSNSEVIKACEDPQIDLIQAPFNLFDNWNRRSKTFELAKSKTKILHVRSIYLQGLFFIAPEQLPSHLKSFAGPIKSIREIAERLNLSIEQLSWRYVNSFSAIDSVVVGVEEPIQLMQTVKASKLPPLDFKTLDEIHKIEIEDENLLLPSNWKAK